MIPIHDKGASWYGKLLLFVSASVFSFIAGADQETRCEYRLINPRAQPLFFSHFEEALEATGPNAEVYVHPAATESATRRFGISAVDRGGLSLDITRNPMDHNEVLLSVKNSGKVIFKASLNIPPLYVWRDYGEEGNGTFNGKMGLTLPKDVKIWLEVGVGSIFENGYEMRKFISFERNAKGEVDLVIGMDVACETALHYSKAGSFRYIILRPEYYLCRVPVLVVSGAL